MPSYDINHYRSLFPHIKLGLTYLDHAAVGPFSKPVNDAILDYIRRKSETELNIFFNFLKTVAATKEQIGTLINSQKERIAFTDNTTNGLNILAAGLDWKSGDRIVLTDMEFPANVNPFLNQKRHGVEIDFVKNKNGKILMEDMERAITPRTRVLSISHVQFLHGLRSDLAPIGELCREKGVVFCVDAIQSAGVVPIDVRAMKIDFLSCGCQKWLLAPEGVGFIYVSEETQEKIRQAHLGWTSNRDFFSDFLRYRVELDPTARRYENSTYNCAGIAGLHASLSMILEIGVPNITGHLGQLTNSAIERLRRTSWELLTSVEPQERAGIVTFRPPNAKAMFERLKSKNITVSLREGCIRLSPHFYNTEEDVSAALEIAMSN